MAIHIVSAQEFLLLAAEHAVIDVRSPAEFSHAHIPGAYSLPLFTDAERAQVGTVYKQASREQAIKIGLDVFGPKMRQIVEAAEDIIRSRKVEDKLPGTLLVYCARGGMRSSALTWLFDLYGFTVYRLEGGYKSYRNRVLHQLELDYNFEIIGGGTGSGKTAMLHLLQQSFYVVLDLEYLAQHKGSAFGGLGQEPQPSQEMFENRLADRLEEIQRKHPNMPVYLEDESQRIGSVNIPGQLWQRIQQKPMLALDIPFEARLDYITEEYGNLPIEGLINAIVRIKKRLGPLETKTAISHLVEGDTSACFNILVRYYDKQYRKAAGLRESSARAIHNIPCTAVDITANTAALIRHLTAHVSN